MNPEIWMPYYGQDFDRKTKGWPRALRWSYLASIWAYWCGECSGLPNNDEILRGVCECDPADWAVTKGMIFGSKFKLRDGMWHNERAFDEYSHAVANMQSSQKKGKAGADVRWGSSSAMAGAMPEVIAEAYSKHCPTDTPSPSPSPSHSQPPISDKASDKGDKALSVEARELAKRFEQTLGAQWANDSGKWINRIKREQPKTLRVMLEVRNAQREGRIRTTPAAYAEQIWKEFK